MKKPNAPKLTPASKRLLDAFADSAAQHHWQQDQGNGPAVDRAEKQYLCDKAKLETYVLKLQQKAKRK